MDLHALFRTELIAWRSLVSHWEYKNQNEMHWIIGKSIKYTTTKIYDISRVDFILCSRIIYCGR